MTTDATILIRRGWNPAVAAVALAASWLAQLVHSVRRWNSSEPPADYAGFRATLKEYRVAYLAWTEKPTDGGALGLAGMAPTAGPEADAR